MLFIGFLILIVGVALAYAAFALSEEFAGPEQTRAWLQSIPGRVGRRLVVCLRGLRRGSIAFLKAVLLVRPPDTRSNAHGQVSAGSACSTQSPADGCRFGRRRRPRQPRGRGQAAEFGAREAIQLLGVAFLVARIFGWLDSDGVDDSLGEVDPDPESLGEAQVSEMPPNPGDQYVKPYMRNGEWVEGHFRTNADATDRNNYSGPIGDFYRWLNGRR